MQGRFATIGHSNRERADFIAMLRAAGIELLVDVRSFPASRHNPAFNAEGLSAALAEVGIGYRHCRALGGRRGVQAGVDPCLNALWRVASFHNYADYALGPEFAAAFAELLRLGAGRTVALMCAEAVWWRCHRRIIADYLLLAGRPVTHLMAPGHSEPAAPTPGAQPDGEGRVVYPPPGPAATR
jgi:uncharacterized protein (DUF488 family)